MSLYAQGIGNLNPMQGSFPSEQADNLPNIQFQGNIKLTRGRLDETRVIDPSETVAVKGGEWKRPLLRPIPAADRSTAEYMILLNGTWELSEDEGKDEWKEVPVPGELMALGYEVLRGKWFAYRKKIDVPAGWTGRKIFLRFGMVYELAEVTVNGQFIRKHKGAFTTFDCDITDAVQPGEQAEILVRCTHTWDATTEFTAAPGESAPGRAGIIDDVTLYSLPSTHLTHLCYHTQLDEAYTNAALRVELEYTHDGSGTSERLLLSLTDPGGQKVPLRESAFSLAGGEAALSIPIAVPQKWDAEHPNLYSLHLEIGQLCYELPVGFRSVERKGDELYINGAKTKLRGAAMYGEDPILGRVFSREQLERIVSAAKWANINYLRSSAYPERAALYELCDRYGIYVEECMPINFQRGTWDSRFDQKVRPLSNLPAYEEQFLEQAAEVIERDRNHPSVIIWEYGNESDWGMNFKSVMAYIAKEDPTRLTAGTWDNRFTSLASYHYPQYDELISGAALYDEYAHVATHALDTIRRDPGIRNAWGESVRRGWNAIYPSAGTVGAAIFAMSDMLLFRPGGDIGGWQYGQWGLLDAWLREKPELWLTKKAYSPVKLPDKAIEKPQKGLPLAIPVQNRFNHTNLSEIRFAWKVVSGGHSETEPSAGDCMGPSTAPGFLGVLLLPERDYHAGDVVEIRIFDRQDQEIDFYQLEILDAETPRAGKRTSAQPHSPVTLAQSGDEAVITGERFRVVFSARTGLLKTAVYDGKQLLCGGPYLNLHGAFYKGTVFQNDQNGEFSVAPSGFRCTAFHAEETAGEALVTISGEYPGGSQSDAWGFLHQYEPVRVRFAVRVTGDGALHTGFTVENPPPAFLYEVGVSYLLPDDLSEIQWKKEAVCSGYPADHIGRPEGRAILHRAAGVDAYRVKPVWRWSADETNFPLYGSSDGGHHGTNDFIATRENIYFYSCLTPGDIRHVRVESDGRSLAVRICPAWNEDKDLPECLKLSMNTELYYDLGGGSSAIIKSGDGYMGNYVVPEIHLTGPYTAEVMLRLTDEPDR